MEKYIFYSDGAATMRKVNGEYVREDGGWAFIFIENNQVIQGAYGGENKTSNNAMELTAILKALQLFNSFKKTGVEMEIYSDSAYCINIFTQWIKGWKNNGWTKGKKHESIENIELIKTIDKEMELATNNFNKISFVKVKGHSGDKWNEYVDKLAVKGKVEKSCHGLSISF